MFLEICEVDPAHFLSAPGLAWQAALKKTEVKLDLLTDIDMLLMAEKGITREICNSIYQYTKGNNKYLKYYDKNKEHSYKQWYVNNLYGWVMSYKLPVQNFKRVKNISKFDEHFIKCYYEESDTGYFLEINKQYPEKLYELHNGLPFLSDKMKIEKVGKIVANLHDKIEYVIHIINLKQA